MIFYDCLYLLNILSSLFHCKPILSSISDIIIYLVTSVDGYQIPTNWRWLMANIHCDLQQRLISSNILCSRMVSQTSLWCGLDAFLLDFNVKHHNQRHSVSVAEYGFVHQWYCSVSDDISRFSHLASHPSSKNGKLEILTSHLSDIDSVK